MIDQTARTVIIVGAGIAGLTAALAFTIKGFAVKILERADILEEVGAGIQLSPNATRILDRLGVLQALLPKAVRPNAVVLRSAKTLRELARVPLGDFATKRWGAPYLALHRADLQKALLDEVARQGSIELVLGAKVSTITGNADEVRVAFAKGGETREASASLLIGADGVRSTVRELTQTGGGCSFAGQLAWRRTIEAGSEVAASLIGIGAGAVVTAFLHPGFHLIVYPMRSGRAFNLAAFTKSSSFIGADVSSLVSQLRSVAPALSSLASNAEAWSAWPIFTVDPKPAWTSSRIALIGDAAHAMTPFAAQGAAMTIEDADSLAAFVASQPLDIGTALTSWEAARRPRIARVARRGAFNELAWHAGGHIALARDLVLKVRSPEKLAADMDWLYGRHSA